MKNKLLLMSSSYIHGGDYLQHYSEVLNDFLKKVQTIIFVPYAAAESAWDSYTEKVRLHFKNLNGISVTGLHEMNDELIYTPYATAIFIGGGNTFRLLAKLHENYLMDRIQKAVYLNNLLYMGVSAGTNVACPTICNTNDMPIVHPSRGFEAIGLVNFQINPHYLDPDPNSKHMGETREQRINEYHQMNVLPVVGLREGAYIRVESNYYKDNIFRLGGSGGARLFVKGKTPMEFEREIEGAVSVCLHSPLKPTIQERYARSHGIRI